MGLQTRVWTLLSQLEIFHFLFLTLLPDLDFCFLIIWDACEPSIAVAVPVPVKKQPLKQLSSFTAWIY